MIIRCPECSTGFNLPDERVSEKGVKLRCSRCSHVFRVRAADGDGEEVEIFYQDEDNSEEAEEAAAAEESGEKKLKLPKKGGLNLGGSSSANPFPHAGLNLKPKASSALGGRDAFEGAFDEPSEAEEMEEVAAATPAAKFGPPPGVKVAGAPPTAAAPAVAAPAAAASPAPVLGNGNSAFGDASEMVDDSFGQDGPYFDPNTGKVESPAAPAGPAGPVSSAGGPGAGARRPGAPVVQAAAAPAPKAAAARFDDIDDLEPHRIGGSGGSKVVMLLLIISVVGMGFLGAVAALNGGFLDFKNFGQMIEVAFSDGEYTPREEWARPTQTTIIQAPEDPLAVESVYGQLVDIGRSDKVLVVRGFVRSYADQAFHNVELRATVSSAEGRPLREVSGVAGGDVSVAEVAGQKSVEDARALVRGGGQSVNAGGMVPFTLVVDEVPQTVLDGGSFGLKVSVVDQAGGGAPVAAGE